jgi:hypothetical protein
VAALGRYPCDDVEVADKKLGNASQSGFCPLPALPTWVERSPIHAVSRDWYDTGFRGRQNDAHKDALLELR